MSAGTFETRNYVVPLALAVVLVGAVYAAVHTEGAIEAGINTGKCVDRCIAQLGMKAKIICIATCTQNPSAY